MTNYKALREAQRRWGKNARIEYRNCPRAESRYLVGVIMLGMFFEIRGQGSSFENAFSDVDKREASRKASERLASEHPPEEGGEPDAVPSDAHDRGM